MSTLINLDLQLNINQIKYNMYNDLFYESQPKQVCYLNITKSLCHSFLSTTLVTSLTF